MRQNRTIARLLTRDEYLAFEERSDIRHEYVAGEVYAMSGASTRHNVITLNIVSRLRDAARRRGCRVFATDVKVAVGDDRIYYPDVMLACGMAAEVELIVAEPSLVVEVASPGTRAIDRREKLASYRELASLRQYLIVEQHRRFVLAYTRTAQDTWERAAFTLQDAVPIPVLELELALNDIYEDVTLPPLGVGEEVDAEYDWMDTET